MLYDKKHLKQSAIGVLVSNMKNEIRKTFNNNQNDQKGKYGIKKVVKENTRITEGKEIYESSFKFKLNQIIDSMKELIGGT